MNQPSKVLAIKGYTVDIITSTEAIRMGTGNMLSFFDAITDFRQLLDYVVDYLT